MRQVTARVKHPCFGVWAAVCDPSPKAECVPAFRCDSECETFVGEVKKQDEEWLPECLSR